MDSKKRARQAAEPSKNLDRPLNAYQQTIRDFSDRLIEAQKSLRVLDAVKWGADVEERFFLQKCRELPDVHLAYYQNRPLAFDPAAKKRELQKIELDVVNHLGRLSSVGEILRRICREYAIVIDMLANRGRKAFAARSRELYGSTREAFHAGEPTLADFADAMASSLAKISTTLAFQNEELTITGEQAIAILDQRFRTAFSGQGIDTSVRVVLDDGIVADAAAGSDYLKIRKDALFSRCAICASWGEIADPAP